MVKIVSDSVRMADDGRVEYTLVLDGREVKGFIEQTFFDDFFGGQQQASLARKQAAVRENLSYFETVAAQQLRMGLHQVVIR